MIVGRSGAKFVLQVLFYKSVSLVNMCRKMKRQKKKVQKKEGARKNKEGTHVLDLRFSRQYVLS